MSDIKWKKKVKAIKTNTICQNTSYSERNVYCWFLMRNQNKQSNKGRENVVDGMIK